MNTRPVKSCQWSGCAHAALPTERFCLEHRKAMVKQMEQAGYLQELPRREPRRPSTAKENRRETKFGVDR